MKAINKARALLDNEGVRSSRLEAEMLMTHILGCLRHHLYINRDRLLTAKESQKYFSLVKKRLKGAPIHYIIGYREFMGLNFCVNEDVLIPRPDTEVLVEYIIDYARDREPYSFRILDIGTGSGAIAISLAKYIDSSQVIATDIEASALLVAKKNAAIHGVDSKVRFVQGDLFSALEGVGTQFDIIVSNPPYIPKDEMKELEPQVKDYEPIKALDGGEDGLDFYRRLAEGAPDFLLPGGLWAVEVGYNQAQQVAEILETAGCYGDIGFIKDLAGYNRVVVAVMSGSGDWD
ncbi:MAG: peptide chain release factor N(5)-glutamine methyltransferase [Clostridiales bacterium]|nr:peptide chain release factor N(5)-glutamine methyltransferase [Clostridiales bacterium]